MRRDKPENFPKKGSNREMMMGGIEKEEDGEEDNIVWSMKTR